MPSIAASLISTEMQRQAIHHCWMAKNQRKVYLQPFGEWPLQLAEQLIVQEIKLLVTYTSSGAYGICFAEKERLPEQFQALLGQSLSTVKTELHKNDLHIGEFAFGFSEQLEARSHYGNDLLLSHPEQIPDTVLNLVFNQSPFHELLHEVKKNRDCLLGFNADGQIMQRTSVDAVEPFLFHQEDYFFKS